VSGQNRPAGSANQPRLHSPLLIQTSSQRSFRLITLIRPSQPMRHRCALPKQCSSWRLRRRALCAQKRNGDSCDSQLLRSLFRWQRRVYDSLTPAFSALAGRALGSYVRSRLSGVPHYAGDSPSFCPICWARPDKWWLSQMLLARDRPGRQAFLRRVAASRPGKIRRRRPPRAESHRVATDAVQSPGAAGPESAGPLVIHFVGLRIGDAVDDPGARLAHRPFHSGKHRVEFYFHAYGRHLGDPLASGAAEMLLFCTSANSGSRHSGRCGREHTPLVALDEYSQLSASETFIDHR
jgi:hypothetical protein